MVGLTPRHTYNASLGLVLRALAHMRAGGALLHAAEWGMYSKALHTDCICQRMAVVASVSGDSEEVCCLSLSPGASCTCLSACCLFSVCLTTISDLVCVTGRLFTCWSLLVYVVSSLSIWTALSVCLTPRAFCLSVCLCVCLMHHFQPHLVCAVPSCTPTPLLPCISITANVVPGHALSLLVLFASRRKLYSPETAVHLQLLSATAMSSMQSCCL